MGIIIILGAFALGNKKTDSTANTAGVEIAPERTYLTETDSDNDGTPDWEENFNDRIFETIATPDDTSASSTYVPPTTFTGKFAEAFFKDYVEGKSDGADMSDPSELVSGAVSAIEANTKSKMYTPANITVIPDSDVALREYGNAIGEILIKYSANNENEGLILQRALEKNDPSVLNGLAPILRAYENYIQYTLLVPTPNSLASNHLLLLNAYEAIRTDIVAMQQAFTDPLYSLARIKRYQDDAQGLYVALKNINKALSDAAIYYAKDETGAVLYLWSN